MKKIIGLALAGLISVALASPVFAQTTTSDTTEAQKESVPKEAKQKKKTKQKKKDKKAKKKAHSNDGGTNTPSSELKKDWQKSPRRMTFYRIFLWPIKTPHECVMKGYLLDPEQSCKQGFEHADS